MSVSRRSARWFLVLALTVIGPQAWSRINLPTTDTSDGVFNPQQNIQVDLSQAVTGSWDTTTGTLGKGVYDPKLWAVVYRYQSVSIPANVTVTFKNHPMGAPVIWLVQGDVTLDGGVRLNGENGRDDMSTCAEPGPGGFRGGCSPAAGSAASAGFGPGGGGVSPTGGAGASGSYAYAGNTLNGALPGAIYGNNAIFPLIGGSGAAGGSYYGYNYGGGAGGGAILITAAGKIQLNGWINANGGSWWDNVGGGSGGAIRLLADTVSGPGDLMAVGGAGGGFGRIRVEAVTNTLTGLGEPHYNASTPDDPPVIFMGSTTPSIRSVSLGGVTVPVDPKARLTYPPDVQLDAEGNATLLLEVRNCNPATSKVNVRIVRDSGLESLTTATLTGGDSASSSWQAVVNMKSGFASIQPRLILP